MPEDMKEKISTMITESGLNAKDFSPDYTSL